MSSLCYTHVGMMVVCVCVRRELCCFNQFTSTTLLAYCYYHHLESLFSPFPFLPSLLPSLEPGAMVTNVSANLAGNFKVNITWQSLQEKDWNGMPFGFAVSEIVCIHMRIPVLTTEKFT